VLFNYALKKTTQACTNAGAVDLSASTAPLNAAADRAVDADEIERAITAFAQSPC
jgi:hypothetical protein